jgi:hypothetical protein
MSSKGNQGVRWLVLWIAGAATAAIGALLLYLGPNLLPVGKGYVPTPFLGQAPVALLAIGIIGIVVGAVGVVRSLWRAPASPAQSQPAGRRLADSAARGALIVAVVALMTAILTEFVWPTIASTMRAGPCDQDPTVACFVGHPDYYQETAPGGYSTPVSRIGDNLVTPAMLAAWPLALAAALVGAGALVKETRRRRVAILAMILGSVTVVWMVTWYLAFLVFGGGD